MNLTNKNKIKTNYDKLFRIARILILYETHKRRNFNTTREEK